MNFMKKVIVYGNTVLSKMIYYDALNDPDFQIVCFAVDTEYLNDPIFLGLPQVDFAEVTALYPPDDYDMIAVLGGYSCMRNREKFYHRAKEKGYKLRNFISKRADITPTNEMGENNIIFGPSHIGMEGKMGNNNIIRQNVYLGHNFEMGSNIFIGAGCNIGGNCTIKDTSYIAMGSTVINNITLAEETLVGAGSVVIHDSEPYSKNVGNPSRIIGYHTEEGIRMRIP